MNIAERIKSYYEHKDFISNYTLMLLEDKSNVINRIKEIARIEYYFEKKYGQNIFLSYNQAEEIYQYILDNFDSFLSTFKNYYTGGTDIDSVAFGEQEEQLEGIYNNKTGKQYSVKYLKKIFEDTGFYVNNNNYAYYDLSGEGVYIDLLKSDIPLIKQWIESEKIEANN